MTAPSSSLPSDDFAVEESEEAENLYFAQQAVELAKVEYDLEQAGLMEEWRELLRWNRWFDGALDVQLAHAQALLNRERRSFEVDAIDTNFRAFPPAEVR